MRVKILLLSTLVLIILALSPTVWAQSQRTFYLHSGCSLDERLPFLTIANALKLGGGGYYWNTTAFSSEQSFVLGTWTVTLWMNITTEPTQYGVTLGVNNQSGNFIELSDLHTPISSSSPTQCKFAMEGVRAFKIRAGGYLVLALLRHWQGSEQLSPAAFLFFDSVGAPSRLAAPVQAEQLVQNYGMGPAAAVIGIGAGAAAVVPCM